MVLAPRRRAAVAVAASAVGLAVRGAVPGGSTTPLAAGAVRASTLTTVTLTTVGDDSSGLVLVVEDERHIADLIRLYLARDGFGAHVCADGADGLAAARLLAPVAIILDIRLPGMNGLDIIRTLRREENWIPVLIVTARDDEADRILGLELGADDYVTKPFSPRELVTRLRTVLRRTAGAPDISQTLRAGTVVMDLGRRRVLADGRDVVLTATEFDLLSTLLRRPGLVHSRERLLSQVWGYSAAAGTRTVDVHVAQVRAKLGDASPIRTVRGVGYTADA
nr:response regulator transcription factor [Frankia sp. Cas3]